jgi:hypothetical protein
MATFTVIDDLRESVRALVPNMTPDVLSDEKLDIHLEMGMRRLNRDLPRDRAGTISGDDGKWYTLSAQATSWVDGFSVIKSIVQPTPNQANEEIIQYLDSEDYEVHDDGVSLKIRFVSAISTGKTATIRFTTTWLLAELDGAASTTLPARLNNALAWIGAAYACYALGAQAAGTTNSSLPGDLINYRSKQREYRSMGQEFEAQYQTEVGTDDAKKAAAAGIRRRYQRNLQNGFSYFTHSFGR